MEEDYGAFLFADGTLGVSILKDLLAQGSVPLSNECGVILSFTSFHAPGNIAATKTTDHARH
jgi:hypothetical protein